MGEIITTTARLATPDYSKWVMEQIINIKKHSILVVDPRILRDGAQCPRLSSLSGVVSYQDPPLKKSRKGFVKL